MTGILQNYLPLVVFIGVAALIGLAALPKGANVEIEIIAHF